MCYNETYTLPFLITNNILQPILYPTLFPGVSIPIQASSRVSYIPYLDYTEEGELCLKFSKEKYSVWNLWSYVVEDYSLTNMYQEIDEDKVILINDELRKIQCP